MGGGVARFDTLTGNFSISLFCVARPLIAVLLIDVLTLVVKLCWKGGQKAS